MSSRFGLRLRTPLVETKPRRRARASKTAPAAIYPFGRSRSLKFGLAALWLSGAVVSLFLLLTRPVHALYPWFAGFSVLFGACAAVWGWRQTKTGSLRWDGDDWWVEIHSAEVAKPPQLVTGLMIQLDFQFFLLLSVKSEAGDFLWLWLDSWSQKREWQNLRRAVFSPRPAAEVPDSTLTKRQVAHERGVSA